MTEQGRPAPPRRRWLPAIVLVVVAALIAGLSFVASAVGVGPDHTSALRFVPDDGAVAYERIDRARGATRATTAAVTESARFAGVAGLLSTDTAFANQIITSVLDDYEGIQIWRTTTSAIPAAGAAATPPPSTDDQIVQVYRVNADVQLLGESAPDFAFAYKPGLVVLPASAAPGTSWTGTGSAGPAFSYRSSFRAEAAGDGCLRVSGEIRYTATSGRGSWTWPQTRTWCPGRGVVESRFVREGTTVTTAPAPFARPPVQTAAGPLRWAAPAGWRHQSLTAVSANPIFGKGQISASPSTRTPVRTSSGLLIRPVVAVEDLLGTRATAPTTWTSIWRAHPGGTLLTVTEFGNVVVATTSARQVVAYDDHGVRLWQFALDDLAPTPPVRASDTDAVLADQAGTVRRFDLRTGALRWQRRLQADVVVAPAAGGGVVLVGDRGGQTHALELTDGTERWSADLLASGLAVLGDQAVVLQDQTVHSLALDSGRHRWVRPFDGVLTDIASFAGHAVVATETECLLLDQVGAITARLDDVRTLSVGTDHLIGWGVRQASVVGVRGDVQARWPLPPLANGASTRMVAVGPDGVWLFGSKWDFEGWGDDG